jgi:hypothetical protein
MNQGEHFVEDGINIWWMEKLVGPSSCLYDAINHIGGGGSLRADYPLTFHIITNKQLLMNDMMRSEQLLLLSGLIPQFSRAASLL